MTLSPAHTAHLHPAASHAQSLQDDVVPTAEAVARRAHLLFENHGEAKGRDVQDWLQAEAELTAESLSSGR
jgi:hypothetical protein